MLTINFIWFNFVWFHSEWEYNIITAYVDSRLKDVWRVCSIVLNIVKFSVFIYWKKVYWTVFSCIFHEASVKMKVPTTKLLFISPSVKKQIRNISRLFIFCILYIFKMVIIWHTNHTGLKKKNNTTYYFFFIWKYN